MARIEKLAVGQVLYERKSVKQGNTSMSKSVDYTVRIVEIDLENRTVMASWNGNKAERCYESRISRWKTTKPERKD